MYWKDRRHYEISLNVYKQKSIFFLNIAQQLPTHFYEKYLK